MAETEEKNKKKKGLVCVLIALIVIGIVGVVIGVTGTIFSQSAPEGMITPQSAPSFVEYIKNSKTSQAKTNLRALADGVHAYYKANGHHLEMPEGARIGKVVDRSTRGMKYLPEPADWEKSPWKELRFHFAAPQYYSYFYSTKTTQNGVIVQITASASLSEECDSIFYITIDEQDVESQILEGDASRCNPLGIVK